jgi:hypothetical protein
MKRPFGVTIVAVLMCIGAGLLAIGSLGFFVLGGAAVTVPSRWTDITTVLGNGIDWRRNIYDPRRDLCHFGHLHV